jgi:hypothetical protein
MMTEIAGFRTTEMAGMTFYICLYCGDPCSSEEDAHDHQSREFLYCKSYGERKSSEPARLEKMTWD